MTAQKSQYTHAQIMERYWDVKQTEHENCRSFRLNTRRAGQTVRLLVLLLHFIYFFRRWNYATAWVTFLCNAPSSAYFQLGIYDIFWWHSYDVWIVCVWFIACCYAILIIGKVDSFSYKMGFFIWHIENPFRNAEFQIFLACSAWMLRWSM